MPAHVEAAATAGGPSIPSQEAQLSGLSRRRRRHPQTQSSTLGSLPLADGDQPWEGAGSAARKRKASARRCAATQPRPSAPERAALGGLSFRSVSSVKRRAPWRPVDGGRATGLLCVLVPMFRQRVHVGAQAH